MLKAAIIDDYQNVALDVASWDSLGSDVCIDVYNDHLAEWKKKNCLQDRISFPSTLSKTGSMEILS